MINQFDLRNRDLLDGIQGNILKAHGRHHTANLFIRFHSGQQPAAKAWIKSLADGEDAIIQSAYTQLRANVLWKENQIDTGLFACLHISAAGYEYLIGPDAHLQFQDTAFRLGMQNTGLNDPAPSTWDTGLADNNHLLLLLAHANPTALAAAVATVVEATEPFARISTIEYGEALLNKEGAGIEHFGYVDGVSQPLFFEEEWEAYKADNNIHQQSDIKFDPRADKSLVLIPDPFVTNDPNARGSYFVFRKLEQNVRGFKQAEHALGQQLGLVGDDAERAGAMIIGRFEDGTPVELSPEAGVIHSAVLNNFDYDAHNGSKCPFHGHIRKSNPRSGMPAGTGGMAEAKKHIMARRGIPFGTRTDDPNDGLFANKPTGGVGLLFMSYQASISHQFEFIQRNWVDNANFPHHQAAIDPVIGQGNHTLSGAFATQWGQPTSLTQASFDQFVHLRGGDYFFAPSLAFLKNL